MYVDLMGTAVVQADTGADGHVPGDASAAANTRRKKDNKKLQQGGQGLAGV